MIANEKGFSSVIDPQEIHAYIVLLILKEWQRRKALMRSWTIAPSGWRISISLWEILLPLLSKLFGSNSRRRSKWLWNASSQSPWKGSSIARNDIQSSLLMENKAPKVLMEIIRKENFIIRHLKPVWGIETKRRVREYVKLNRYLTRRSRIYPFCS